MIAVGYAPPLPTAPAQASAVGYTNHTFGSGMTLGGNWFPYNLLTTTPIAGQALQLNTGVYLPGADGSNYGANICTAYKSGGSWKGIAFGGGFYVEALISFVGVVSATPGVLPFPAFWADDINFLAGTGGYPYTAVGTRHIELDVMQFTQDTLSYYSTTGLIDWYGTGSAQAAQPTNAEAHFASVFTTPHRYGSLWVPATSSTQGYITSWLDGTQIFPATGTTTITWNQFNPLSSANPSVGTTAGSFIDVSQLALICGTCAGAPMTVYSVDVWQGSGATNRVQ